MKNIKLASISLGFLFSISSVFAQRTVIGPVVPGGSGTGSWLGAEGIGGIAVSTNGSGGLVIDGSGIAAGATPAYVITNRNAVANTFTNFGLLQQNNHIQASSNVFVSGTNIAGSLRITNDTVLRGTLQATNGAIVLGQDSIPITFGGHLTQVTGAGMTNWYPLYQKSDIVHDVSGVGNVFASGAQSLFQSGSLLQLNSGARLELDYLTANRVMVTGSGSMATNHPDMRLAVSLSGAADGEVLKYHGASGTWTNATDAGGSGTPAGSSLQVQFNQGGNFAATNDFVVTRGDGGAGQAPIFWVVSSGGGNSNMLTSQSLVAWGASSSLFFGRMGITNWLINGARGDFIPHANNTYDIGNFGAMVRNVISSTYQFGVTNSNTNAAQTVNWTNGMTVFRHTQSGNTTYSITNLPWSSANIGSELFLEIGVPAGATYTTTISPIGPLTIDWQGDGGPIIVAGKTNTIVLRFTGTNIMGRSWQVSTKGTANNPPQFALTAAPSITNAHVVSPLVESVVSTNGIGYVIGTVAGVGGANTNFTLQATAGVTYLNGGLTNVNIVASMPGTAGLQYFPTVFITNLTTTARQLSWSVVTNALRNIQQYDSVTLPITITNKHTVILAYTQEGSNVVWSVKQMTNGF